MCDNKQLWEAVLICWRMLRRRVPDLRVPAVGEARSRMLAEDEADHDLLREILRENYRLEL